MGIKIFEVKTQMDDTRQGHWYDRYNVAAKDAEEAIERVKAGKAGRFSPSEKIQSVNLLAAAD